MSLVGRKVKYLKLHNSVFVPIVGNLKDTILNEDTVTGKGCDMTIDALGVLLITNTEGKNWEILIPNAAISHMVLIKA